MNDSTQPSWFNWVIYAAIAWNLIGVIQFYAHISITPEQIASMPLEQQQLLAAMPTWVDIAFAIAVIFGLLGSIALMMKKALAVQIFVISMVGILAQNFYSLFMSNAVEVMGPAAIAVPATVFTISVLLIWLSISAKGKGWIS